MKSMKNRQTLLYIKKFLLILFILAAASGCSDLFPGLKGHTNPNDPYVPVLDMELIPYSTRGFAMSAVFPDYDSWDTGYDNKDIYPRFIVFILTKDYTAMSPEDGTLVSAIETSEINSKTVGRKLETSFPASNSPDEEINGCYILSAFWSTDYKADYNTLTDDDGSNNKFSGHWSGPVSATFNGGLAASYESGVVPTTGFGDFEATTHQIDSVSDQYILMRFNINILKPVKYGNLILTVKSGTLAAADTINLFEVIIPWDSGDSNLYDIVNSKVLIFYNYIGDNTVYSDGDFLQIEADNFLSKLDGGSDNNGIALRGSVAAPELDFYSASSDSKPFMVWFY